MNPETGDGQGGSEDFDLEAMMNAADEIISRPRIDVANDALHGEVSPDEPVEPAEPESETPPAAEPEPVVPRETPVPAPVAADPLAELPADRRAAMLSIDQILTNDPAKRDAILGILTGAPAAAVAEPQLPEDVDPDSFEAGLWRRQQESDREIAQLREGAAFQAQTAQAQTAAQHAMTAAKQFGERHPELAEADVYEIARYAGNSGVAGAFVEANRRDPIGQLEQAFESVLYANETFRGKVITTAAPVVPGETTTAVERKRKLTALSSGASPVATGPAKSSQLESRPDGRLTPASRQQAVAEVAAGLLRQRIGSLGN